MFGVTSTKAHEHQLDEERLALLDAGRRAFGEAIIINTRECGVALVRGSARARVVLGARDVTEMQMCVARSTSGREASTALLMHGLEAAGCYILDPLSRFGVGKAGKMLTEFDRWRRGVGITSYFAFSPVAMRTLLVDVPLPLVAKPVSGRFARGVELLETPHALSAYINRFYASNDQETPIFIQQFVRMDREYRAMVLNGRVIKLTRRRRPPRELRENDENGARGQRPVKNTTVSRFVEESVSPEGLLGVDIGRGEDRNLYIVEANRAPNWMRFENATGIQVAELVVREGVHQP